MIGFALFTAASAQVTIPLPWTPVPVTGQTLAVLVSGSALGWQAGAASQILYILLGTVGLPFFQNGTSGWDVVSGATGGYLVGFVVCAAIVGVLAQMGQDRRIASSIPAMLAGSAVIYMFGVPWLAHVLGVDAKRAIELGMAPFVIGDAFKLMAAGLLLPAAWRLTRGRQDDEPDEKRRGEVH